MTNAEIDYQVNLINSFNIKHPALDSGLGVVKTAYQSVKKQREMNDGIIPKYYAPDCSLLIGPAGSGKTTFCNFVKNSLPEKDVVSGGFNKKIVPCVYVSIANMSTPKSVTARILEQYGQTVPARVTEDQLLNQIKALFSTCETCLVLLDEIHEIVSGVGQKRVLSWLKGLVNETRVSIFLAGTDEARGIVYSDDELHGRFMKIIQFHYMHYEQGRAHSEFEKYIIALLNKIKTTLPFDEVFSPTQNDLGQLYLATGGNLRSIAKLFIEASREALTAQNGYLSMGNMSNAFNSKTLYIPTPYKGPKDLFSLNKKDLQSHLKMVGVR